MALLDGKQLRDGSLSLNKLNGINGLVTFTTAATMSFNSGATLRQDDDNINIGIDVANKNYVDAVAQGLNIKDPVQVIAATAITLSSDNFQIDGYTVSVGDRVLVNGQAGLGVATNSNGIYEVASGAWSRSTDADGVGEVEIGDFVFVIYGNQYQSTGWVLSQSDSIDFDILVGTESQKWVQFSSAGVYNAGDGLYQIGNDLHVNTGNSVVTGLTISLDAVSLTNTGVTAGVYGGSQSYASFTVDAQGRITNAATWSIASLSGVIGPAEDGTYSDGIFTDFTPSTPIGTAVDRFNEMLLLLAPTPPQSWNNAITGIPFSNTQTSAKALGTGTTVQIYTTSTLNLSCNDNVGAQSLARVNTSGLTFTLINNGVTLDTTSLSGNSTPPKTTGNIRHSGSGDPYGAAAVPPSGVVGKIGFWNGIYDFNLVGSLSVGATTSLRTLQLTHPGTDSPETWNYYVDNPITTSISSLSATVPSMTSNISGVPTLTAGQSITNISFTINNAASNFYSVSPMFTSTTPPTPSLVTTFTGDPDTLPLITPGQSAVVTGRTTTVAVSRFSDLNFSFTVVAKNSAGVNGTTQSYVDTTKRVDTVSPIELNFRYLSGAGSYPSVYGTSYDSTQSLLTGAYVNELQLKNGVFVYPNVNYSSVGGPNYSLATGTRWVTFKPGTFNNNKSFTLNLISSSGITSINQANILIEIKIDGPSGTLFWLNGDDYYSGSGNPGTVTDGVPAVLFAGSTSTSRKITFGTPLYTGDIIVRIGFTGTGPQLASVTATNIV